MNNFIEDQKDIAKRSINIAKKAFDFFSENKDIGSFISWIKSDYEDYRKKLEIKIIDLDKLTEFDEEFIIINDSLSGEIEIGDFVYIEEQNYLFQIINSVEEDDKFYIKKVGINQNRGDN
ncbi:MAG: hypothetical protein ACOCRK_06010 [bacterium]